MRRRDGATVPPRAVELSLRAERQLAQIEDHYLEEAGPLVADEVVTTLLDAMERLGTLPVVYRAAARAGLREYVMGRLPYVLLYRVQAKRIQIAAVIHQRQDR